MPTFASIGLHPAVRSRLVVVAASQNRGSTADNATAPTTTATRPLESPHSLLLHSKEEWRLKGTDDNVTVVAPHEVIKLRLQVAKSMHHATVCGKRQRHIADQVSFARGQNQDRSDRDVDDESFKSGKFKVSRIDGFLSVSDSLHWQNNLQRRPCLSSGVPDWDLFVADNSISSHNCRHSGLIGRAETHGLAWGTVVQLSGGPGVGKTQMALQWTAAAAQQNVQVHYIVPAHASCNSLVQRLIQILGGIEPTDPTLPFLSKVRFHSFRDDCELLLILSELEQEWNGESGSTILQTVKDVPWLLVIDGWSPLISTLKPWRWQRLVLLYHGIVLVVTSSSSSSSSWGSVHLHLDSAGRMICNRHPQQDKVGTLIPVFSSFGKEDESSNIPLANTGEYKI